MYEYKYVKYENQYFILDPNNFEEYMNEERSSSRPTIDPYKYSVAMLSNHRGRVFVSLTINFITEFTIGFKRDWNAFKEAIDEGIRIFEEEIEEKKRQKQLKGKKGKVLQVL